MSADSTLPALGAIPGVTGIHRQTQSPAETRPDTPRIAVHCIAAPRTRIRTRTHTPRTVLAAVPRAVLAAAPQITSSAPSRVNDPAHFN